MKKLSIIILVGALLLAACDSNTDESSSLSEHIFNSELPINSEEKIQMTIEANNALEYDFSNFGNVEIINADLRAMSKEQLELLYQQACYCQAMTDADIDTLREMVPEDATFTHMSGKRQTRDEYFSDIESGALRYFKIGIDTPIVEVNGDSGTVTFTSVLDANAYGAEGVYRMTGAHKFTKRDGKWFTG